MWEREKGYHLCVRERGYHLSDAEVAHERLGEGDRLALSSLPRRVPRGGGAAARVSKDVEFDEPLDRVEAPLLREHSGLALLGHLERLRECVGERGSA